MIGQTVSHYKIIDKIAQGGMGVIYKALDTKLNRTVALKFLPLDITRDAIAKQRFIHEARSASILDHPNICTIYEIDETDKGQMFIAMAYYEGQTIKEKIENDSLTLESALDIMVQICNGLSRSHEAGIVHRDIKPANIMVTERGEVKILDFGLAKLGGDSSLTRTGIAVGTAAYMSPEQASGELVDHRTDIWSLGVMLYEITTKKLPFHGESPRSMVYSIVKNDPSGIKELESRLPRKLIKIISKCLNKRTRDRYQSMADLRTDLVGFSEHYNKEKHTVKLMTDPSRTFRRFPRRKILILLSLLCLLVAIVLLVPASRMVIMDWLGVAKFPTKKHLAVLAISAEGDDPAVRVFGVGMARMISNKLILMEKYQKSLWVVSSKDLQKKRISNSGDANKIFNVNLVVTVNVKRQNNEIKFILKLIDIQLNYQIKSETINGHITNLSLWQDAVMMRIMEILRIKLTSGMRNALEGGGTALPGAFEYCIRGLGYMGHAEDETKLDLAVNCFEQAVKQDPNYTFAIAMLAEAYLNKFKLTQEQVWISKAESCCFKALKNNERARHAHIILGEIHKEREQFKRAFEHIHKVLNDNPEDFYAYLELAKVYECTNNLKKEEECYKKAINSRIDYYEGYDYLGYFYYKNSRFQEAISMYEKSIEFSPYQSIGYNNLGGIYYTIGKTDLALKMFEKSYSIKPDPDLISNLGTLYFYEGRYEDASIMFAKAVQKDKDNYILLGNLADSYRYISKKSVKSLGLYQKAIRLIEKELEKEPDNADLYSILALYHARTGNHKKADIEVNKALELGMNEIEIIRRSIIVFELIEQRDHALINLKEYIIRYGSIENLVRESDLSDLIKDPRYHFILKNRLNRLEGSNKNK